MKQRPSHPLHISRRLGAGILNSELRGEFGALEEPLAFEALSHR